MEAMPAYGPSPGRREVPAGWGRAANVHFSLSLAQDHSTKLCPGWHPNQFLLGPLFPP